MIHRYQFPLRTERLYFQPLSDKDIKPWKAFFINNNQLAFVGISSPDSPIKESKRWIERQVARYESSGVGILGAYTQEERRLIGNCGLIWRENILGEDVYEIGYSVLPTEWGQGYASEMSMFFMNYFISHKLGQKVISIIAIDNIASQKIALKNKMQQGPKFEFQGADCFQFFRSFDH